MTKKGTCEALFEQINAPLEAHSIIVKQGVPIDAHIMDTPLKPKGKPKYQIAQDREVEERPSEERSKEASSKEVEKQIQLPI